MRRDGLYRNVPLTEWRRSPSTASYTSTRLPTAATSCRPSVETTLKTKGRVERLAGTQTFSACPAIVCAAPGQSERRQTLRSSGSGFCRELASFCVLTRTESNVVATAFHAVAVGLRSVATEREKVSVCVEKTKSRLLRCNRSQMQGATGTSDANSSASFEGSRTRAKRKPGPLAILSVHSRTVLIFYPAPHACLVRKGPVALAPTTAFIHL